MARQVIQAAERNMNDETKLNYDFRNPFVICGALMFRSTEDRKTFRVLTAPLVLYQARKETSARSVILQSLAQTHRFAMLSISSPVNNSDSFDVLCFRGRGK
ncbi:unnamed protein product [Microthlaspi erraticum]|uniref:Coatomer alpha subunit C-terminal domain-containing protein n=1 Tax=Microthlaspi erraticum TaxID=1685480 RepID=A0A6D2KYC0_9BRAS|nr:unnamed protein product [Microthlaspi erraticum]